MTFRQVVAAALGVLGVALPATAQAAVTWEQRAELLLGTALTLGSSAPPSVVWTVAGHVDLRAQAERSAFVLTLDPGILYDGGTQSVLTVTEAFFRTRGVSELSVGIERIPLEVARLTIPYSIEPVDILQTRAGVAGARLQWFPNTQTRLRVAMLEDGGRISPLVSARREFTDFEVEAHAFRHAGRTVLGGGGSGLLGSLVVYGELWSLSDPQEWRYAAGLSGSVPDGLWTVEYGYASELPGAPPRHQLAGQVAKQYGPEVTLTATGRLFADPDAYRSEVVVELSRAVGTVEYKVSVQALFGPVPPQAVIASGLRWFF